MSNDEATSLPANLNSNHGHRSELKGNDHNANQRRAELTEALEKLCDVYNYNWSGTNKVVSAAKLLTSFDCERKIGYLLEHSPQKEDASFDPYYSQKSLFVTTVIVDHLKRRLIEEGLEVSVATEKRAVLGVYDVVVKVRRLGDSNQDSSVSFRLEIKGSLGLSLEQIGRYLWDESPLVVVRVIPGHVALLKGTNLQDFVRQSIESTIAKAHRITDDIGIIVPGLQCRDCPEISCPHNWHKESMRKELITLGDSEFQKDITALFQHLPYVAERVVEVVLEELFAPSGKGEVA